MKQWYSAAELAVLRLPDWPSTRRGVQKRCEAEGRESRTVAGKLGGGKAGLSLEYRLSNDEMAALTTLQAEREYAAKQALIAADDAANNIANTANTVNTSKSDAVGAVLRHAGQLATWQRDCAEARLVLVRHVQQRMREGLGKTRAVETVVAEAAAERLPEHLLPFVVVANARSNAERAISRRSLFEWMGLVEQAEQQGYSAVAAVAPKPRAQKIPAWAGALLKVWGQPQKPNLTTVLETLPQLLPEGVACPSYGQAYRYLSEKVGNVEREKGRMGSRSLKNIQPFKRRDTTMLQPSDVYTADGHSFDAEVAHPRHGRPFRPEITTIIDVATRAVVGFSVDLAESGWAVLDALRMACCESGIPAMFYVDNGPGYVNKMMQTMTAQLGITVEHSIAYNSQARGIIERSHQTMWVQAAKKLPTYMGKDMDMQAKQQVFKVTRQEVTAFGRSRALLSWPLFLEMANAVVAEYNNKPHRSLGTLLDPVTSKRRHLSPLEAWARGVEMGAELVRVDAVERDELFMPFEMRQMQRGEVSLFGNTYFCAEMAAVERHGDTVQVHYDIHNPEFVLLRCHQSGRVLGRGTWNGNRTAYFPKSVVLQSQEKRAAGRLNRLAVRQNEVLEELNPRQVLAHLQGQALDVPSAAQVQATLDQLNARADAAVVQPRVVSAGLPQSPLTVVEDTLEVKLSRWLRLDDEFMSTDGIADESERTFWRLFQRSKAFAQLRKENEMLERRLVETAYLKRELF